MNRAPSIYDLVFKEFWLLFGGIWLIVGLTFVAVSFRESGNWTFGLMGAPFALVGGGLVAWSIRKMHRTLRLWREGVRCEASITEVVPANVRINRVQQWMVRFTYRDPYGESRQGESDYMSPEEAAEWHPGDRCWARVDPQRPDLYVWTGKEDLQ